MPFQGKYPKTNLTNARKIERQLLPYQVVLF